MESKPQPKPSKTEVQKLASNYLRDPLQEALTTDDPSIPDEAASVLKFHGSYIQDDRDTRSQRKREGLGKAYSFMVRTRTPGGRFTADQFLMHDHLARHHGFGDLRITSRQGFQIHGVLKANLKTVISGINRSLMTTLAACGDDERNVLYCPAPLANDPIRAALHTDARQLVSHFAPRSSAYYDIWLDGERYVDPDWPAPLPPLVPTPGDDPVEPLYGKAYLPRKFKTAFALPQDNCIDIHSNDLGFLAIAEAGQLVGYNVLVGGGMGTTPSASKTFPAVAELMGYVPRADYLRVAEAVLKVFRDFGNRSDRKRARLKYIVYDLGVAGFKALVEQYLNTPIAPPRLTPALEMHDHLGWNEQGDGKLWLGLPLHCGRVTDEGELRARTALRTYFETYKTPGRLTCQQSILLADIDPANRQAIDRLFRDHGVPMLDTISTFERWAMACVSLPTCPLAVTEAERVLAPLVAEFDRELARIGLDDEPITMHMTGCPNGCARPYNTEIGIVGRSAAKTESGGNEPGTYTIFLGGRATGERLNAVYRDYVPYGEIVATLVPVLEQFARERQPGETFGDFCHRVGVTEPEPATT